MKEMTDEEYQEWFKKFLESYRWRLNGAEYPPVGDGRFCNVCRKEILDFTEVHPCLENGL